MVYIKTVWAVDTEITSALLNHLETQYSEAKGDVDNHNHGDDYYTKAAADAKFWRAGNVGAGSGCDADTIDGKEASYFDGIGAASGIVTWFDGEVVPDGWVACNGENGTPDLRSRLLVGAGGDYVAGTSGGAASITPEGSITVATHQLTLDQIPAHGHSYTDYYPPNLAFYPYTAYSCRSTYSTADRYTGYKGGNDPHGHAGSTFTGTPQENRPPYYALKFIMKG